MPRSRRQELVAQVEEHLSEAIPPDATEAATRTELERLGDPDEIVAEDAERPRHGLRNGRAFEWIAIALLLMGGFIVVVGWFVGVAMLWSSRAWTRRDKLIGTLLLPGGMAGWVCLIVVWSRASFSGGPGSALWVALRILAVVPIFTAVYLVRRISLPVTT